MVIIFGPKFCTETWLTFSIVLFLFFAQFTGSMLFVIPLFWDFIARNFSYYDYFLFLAYFFSFTTTMFIIFLTMFSSSSLSLLFSQRFYTAFTSSFKYSYSCSNVCPFILSFEDPELVLSDFANLSFKFWFYFFRVSHSFRYLSSALVSLMFWWITFSIFVALHAYFNVLMVSSE